MHKKNKLIFFILCTFFLWINAYWALEIFTDLEIIRSQITIWAPATLDFWQIESQAGSQEIIVSTDPWEYFWVKDLKSNATWYYTQISISDLTSPWWSSIDTSNIEFMVTWSVVLMDWYASTWITYPTILNQWFQSFEYPLILIKRNVDIGWVIWKYWVKPIIKITVPWFQPAGVYSADLTFTLIEY